MKIETKQIQLNDGRTALLRTPIPEDAATLLEHLRKTAGETDFLIRYPEECTMTLEQEQTFLQNSLQNPDSIMILCEVEGKLAGNCNLSRHNRLKTKHRASIGIALLREFWGQGIGTAMFEEINRLAQNWGTEQLELEVFADNHRAIAFYEKMGFHIASEHPNAFKRKDGTYVNEYLMIKGLM